MSNGNLWQLVFNQSKVNGAEYFGDRLPSYSWDWPKDTFLQKRLRELKKRRWANDASLREEARASVSPSNRKRRRAQHDDPKWLHKVDPHARIEVR